ncbi:MAG: PAS domain S-box protein [Alphaproteobacteria bacterium]|nr:PAS domain S-box protein [Alphaproteobacteria bacterium]MCW5743899.1 PAS domain S-box protein [Alphaproteobacteria bacterium]
MGGRGSSGVIQRSEEQRFRAVIETAVDGVILIDAAGLILVFNPACERLFGYRADEVIGRNVKLLMPAPYRDEHDAYIANYKRTGIAKIIGIGREVVGRRKDGTTFPMGLSVGETGDERGPSGFVGIIRDLSEMERTQRAALASAARLKAVIDTAVDGVILIDGKGTVLMLNPACERLFGYDAQEVIGRNVKVLMPEPYRSEHDAYLRNYRETGQAQIIGIGREVVGRRKDGTTFPMDLSVGEVKEEGGGSSFVGIIHDLSDRKRTEEQLVQAQKMETVGQLSGGLAHDFNNLLTVIVGNADTLSEALKARPDLRELAEMIAGAAERGAELTNRLLAFSRRQVLQPVAFEPNALVGSMARLIRRTLREDIEVTTALAPALPQAFADRAQLESAMLNLAINAQDAMPDGGQLTITTALAELDEAYLQDHPEVRADTYVVIAVTDNGQGMSPEVRDHAFEPFFTTKEVGKGSGLGLSMVYGFVKQSNGHVSIYSEVGLGTTIRLYLPMDPAARAVTAAQPPATEAVERGRERVLVVEDDPHVRAYAISCLQSLGYHVTSAESGREAERLLMQGAAIDLVFSDVVMPGGMSGWDLAQRARALRPGMKVLLTSGHPLETLHTHSRAVSSESILNKPYRKAELARRIRAVLEAP